VLCFAGACGAEGKKKKMNDVLIDLTIDEKIAEKIRSTANIFKDEIIDKETEKLFQEIEEEVSA
jgi:hypothetical protein